MFPLHRPQTQALASVLCSVVLPKHLQPVLIPSLGLSPSSSHSHTMTRYQVFALFSISYLQGYSFNHKHFLAHRIWDLVFSLLNISYISFCTRTSDLYVGEYLDKTTDLK